MKILITTLIPSFRAVASESAYVHYCEPGPDLSTLFATAYVGDVWICNGKEVTSELMGQWLEQAGHNPTVMMVKDPSALPHLQEYCKSPLTEIAAFPKKTSPDDAWEESVLRAAERLHARSHARPGPPKQLMGNHDPQESSVVLVGAGILNLMTAELLCSRGFRVRIVDQGPDPRACAPEDWTRLGVTSGGGNARMFTHTEADNYNEKGSAIYQDMRYIFRKTTRNGGWSLKSPNDFNEAETAWVETFEQLPAWLARTFREDIYEVTADAGELWNKYMTAKPELFRDVALCEDIVRLYAEPHALHAAANMTRHLGTLIDAPSSPELLRQNPHLATANHSDHLAGGLTIRGFTVNIHRFVEKLIARIVGLGGEFTWNCQVQHVCRNDLGHVTALESQLGPLKADHFVLSPGVTGNALLCGTASQDIIQGVLGIWLQLPNLHMCVKNSMKIHRRNHLVEDINVTMAKDPGSEEDVLLLGGGYGYVGQDRPTPGCPELMALFAALEEVARIYFPEAYEVAKRRGTLWPGGHRKFCVQPFTPTGLGVFESIPTAGGGHLVITGGNNTGGFAQSPAIARAVLHTLLGKPDPIQVLFHPNRGKLPASVHSQPQAHQVISTNIIHQPASPKLLLLCSDGSQHRYLRYRLDKAFPGYRCIVEPYEGQIRHLQRKGRTADVAFMRYHSMRRRIMGYEHERSAYFDRMVPQDYVPSSPDLVVDSLNCSQVWSAVEQWRPDITIVSGAKYIGRKLNERAGIMINLHVGHLPEYKGNHTIFFALYNGELDKVAVTLHQLTSTLDGGDILDVVYPPILPSDDEDTLYTRCIHMGMDRLLEHIEKFFCGQKLSFVPQKEIGEMFRHRDRTLAREVWLWWDIAINGLLRNYSTGQKSD